MQIKKEPMKVDEGAYGTRTVNMEFPPNSRKTRDEEKKVQKVIKGSVVTQKKSLGKKITETFFGEDIGSVSSYILHDVVIPAAKNTLSEMVSGGIEMLLFGETRGSRTLRDKGKSYVSYSSKYKEQRREPERKDAAYRNRARHNFDDIVLDTRGEAEEVLSHLVDLTEDFGGARVADLYDLVGLESQFTDDKYGWMTLNTATVSRVRKGYLINLPKPILMD